MYIGLHVQYRYSCLIFMKLEFSWRVFRKILKYQISWKRLSVPAELFHADGETDRNDVANSRLQTKDIDFRSFWNGYTLLSLTYQRRTTGFSPPSEWL